MATIAENLKSISDSKAAIKTAIIAKGVAVSDSDALNTYAAKIDSIVAGSSGETSLAKFLDGQLQTITPEDVTGMQKLQGLSFHFFEIFPFFALSSLKS